MPEKNLEERAREAGLNPEDYDSKGDLETAVMEAEAEQRSGETTSEDEDQA